MIVLSRFISPEVFSKTTFSTASSKSEKAAGPLSVNFPSILLKLEVIVVTKLGSKERRSLSLSYPEEIIIPRQDLFLNITRVVNSYTPQQLVIVLYNKIDLH